MTVHIHPKDSGPIDTADRTHCNQCDHVIAVKGKRCYRDKPPGKRKRKSWHTTYYQVCPYCNGSQSHNTDTVECGECGSYVDSMELTRIRPSQTESGNQEWECPCCDSRLTEENSRIID